MAGAEACHNFQKERYAIKNDTATIALRQPESVDDPLTEIFLLLRPFSGGLVAVQSHASAARNALFDRNMFWGLGTS